MKGISLLMFLALSCASNEEVTVESGPGLILPPAMHCLRGREDGARTGVFRYSYIAGSEGHAKDIKILKTPFKSKEINVCLRVTIRAERIPKFPDERRLIQELYFDR